MVGELFHHHRFALPSTPVVYAMHSLNPLEQVQLNAKFTAAFQSAIPSAANNTRCPLSWSSSPARWWRDWLAAQSASPNSYVPNERFTPMMLSPFSSMLT